MNKAGEKEGIYNIKCADVSETKTTSCTKGCMEGYVVATKMNERKKPDYSQVIMVLFQRYATPAPNAGPTSRILAMYT